VIESVADANIGSIMGIGFPGWTGGVLRYINGYHDGLTGFVARARELAATYGDRFQPPASLIEKAERGETYEDGPALVAAYKRLLAGEWRRLSSAEADERAAGVFDDGEGAGRPAMIDRGRTEARGTHRTDYRPGARTAARARSSCRSQDPPRLVLPQLPAARASPRAGACRGGAAGVCVRRLDQACGSARREPRVVHQQERGQPDRRPTRRAS
jgi:hypothetical protein